MKVLVGLVREWDALAAEAKVKAAMVERLLDQFSAVNATRTAVDFALPEQVRSNLRAKVFAAVARELNDLEADLPRFEYVCRRAEAFCVDCENEEAYVVSRFFRAGTARRRFACCRAQKLLSSSLALDDVRVLSRAFDDDDVDSCVLRSKVDRIVAVIDARNSFDSEPAFV